MKEFPPALSFPCSIQLHPRRNTESQDQKSAEHNNESTGSADVKPQQNTQCGTDSRGEYMCLMCKDTFNDGVSLAHHKNEDHNVVHLCPQCYSNFPDQKELSHHLKTMHKPTIADIDGPGKMIQKVIQTNTGGTLGAATCTGPDTELTPSSTEKGGAREKSTSKCKENGHVSDSCPRPRPAGVETEFLKAFPKSKTAYEAAVALGHFDTALIKQWDDHLMAYITLERKLESATPTIPPPEPSKCM